ncbi:hypothetical protein KCU71_g9733, partial [Aureobasidium melanogenum]
MDSGMQSPAMADHLLHSAWNPYNPRFMNQPLATSMHAVVPHNYMPYNPQPVNADPAIVHQLQDRINVLEQQQFQDGLHTHFRNLQNSQSLQNLEYRFQHMQKSLSYDNSSLRLQVLDLQARQDVRDNEDCTRRIQLEPRSREQKLESAMKNVNLMRIYAGVSLSGNTTFEEVSLRGAEQMEALAKTLRSRVNRGGAAYLLEAEDAEAWAAKLREDVKPTQEREIDNKLPENLEVPAEDKSEPVNHADADTQDVSWDACLARRQDEPVEWNLSPRSKAASPVRGSHTPSATVKSFVPQIPSPDLNATWTVEEKALSAKLSYPNSYASRHSARSKASSSAVPIKIEEPSESNVSPAQIEAATELKPRKATAPHQKYAAQQTKALEDLDLPKDASMKEEPASSITPESPEVEKAVEKAQVPSSSPKHAPLKENSAPSITPENAKVEKVVAEAQVPSKKLPPHRRFVSAQQAEASKLSEVEPVITTKEKTPLPSVKTTNKPKKSKSRKKARKMEEHKIAEVALTTKNHDEPQEKMTPENQDEPEKDALSEKQDELEKDTPPKKQEETVSAPETKVQTWQPSYLRDLPSLPEDELENIPLSQEMHHFERSFILSHLGGTRWLPSFYSVPEDELSLLPGRGFYLFEDTSEPLAPSAPGTHGSLLTPILRLPEENNPATPKPESMLSAPLFIKKGEKYIYYGMYSYLRSDRLDIERCTSLIPSYLKHFWAIQLTSPSRPKWVTEVLQQHLCPPPTYCGPLPSHTSDDAASSALTAHMQNHEAWHRDTHLKTSFLKAEHILAAFEAPDTGAEMPGIRFWCLGLRCEGWDKGFYDMMVREEKVWEKEGRRDGEKERERQKEILRVLGRKGRPVKW